MFDFEWESIGTDGLRIGVELGSSSLKAIAVDRSGRIRWRFKHPHQSGDGSLFTKIQQEADRLSIPLGIAGNTSTNGDETRLDAIVCLHTAARRLAPKATNVLEVGASHYCLLRLNHDAQIHSIQTNPLCASGTGAFLDAQAERMELADQDLRASERDTRPPSIATRCAVFAKSDLIHRQQEGYSRRALWSGLCQGLADGLINTLTNGTSLAGRTALCGGVALNEVFVAWLRDRLEQEGETADLEVISDPEYVIALGAAFLVDATPPLPDVSEVSSRSPERARRPPLRLVRSRFPEYRPHESGIDESGNEFTVHAAAGEPGSRSVFMGVDIGSTSTKLALIDEGGRILLDVYRATQGNPVRATQQLFEAVSAAGRRRGVGWEFRGVATTGSGRKLIGKLIGADLIVNEITAHVTGTVQLEPDVESIFEIGGQDAKFMSVRHGRIVDTNMNYICAAGTGSFIEELAAKLGIEVDELGDLVLGTTPPYTSTRCTVFMEQDILKLIQSGIPQKEAAGAVVYSVIENYLDRVVGRRPVSRRRVVFQGATARNKGLVAAIENILDVEVSVPPYPHVMGAFGAALLARAQRSEQPTGFRGLALSRLRIEIESEECELCTNRCQLSRAIIEGEREQPLWGMKCGREEDEPRARRPEAFELFEKRKGAVVKHGRTRSRRGEEPRLVTPFTLAAYSLTPFWQALFEQLGIDWTVGEPTDPSTLDLGVRAAPSELCLPVKAAFGHVTRLFGKDETSWLFIPNLIADYEIRGTTQTRFCPYVEVLPSLLRSHWHADPEKARRIIAPVIDFRLSDEKNAEELAEFLTPLGSFRITDVREALVAGHRARADFEKKLVDMGRSRLAELRDSDKTAVVIFGRPYNTLDSVLNHQVPDLIASQGIDVIPMDSLPFDPSLLTGDFSNMFWAYGQRILSALIQVARVPKLYGVYLSSFGCGPDSYILSFAEDIMGDKPFLILELDEHGSSGGYQTRVEAFLDVIAADGSEPKTAPREWRPPENTATPEDLNGRTLYLPDMHPAGARLLTAAFCSGGFDAVTLPPDDEASYALGKKQTRGAECLPQPLTLGSLLGKVEQEKKEGRNPAETCAFFMPTSEGPCRFGQYRTLDRIVLDRIGLSEIPILSPSSENAYYGLDKKIFEYVLVSDILFKLRCRTAPYEKSSGDAEELFERWVSQAEEEIRSNRIDACELLSKAGREFRRILVRRDQRPLVGIVGEIFVRCNPFANKGLVETIEKLGGEAWLAPTAEWVLYTAWVERYRLRRKGMAPWQALKLGLRWWYMVRKERLLYRAVGEVLADRHEPSIDRIAAEGSKYVPPDFEGETVLTLGRTVLFAREGVDLVVNCAPFGCMIGNVTSAFFEHMVDSVPIPIVNMFYDGDQDNSVLAAFMHEAVRRHDNGRATRSAQPSREMRVIAGDENP